MPAAPRADYEKFGAELRLNIIAMLACLRYPVNLLIFIFDPQGYANI